MNQIDLLDCIDHLRTTRDLVGAASLATHGLGRSQGDAMAALQHHIAVRLEHLDAMISAIAGAVSPVGSAS